MALCAAVYVAQHDAHAFFATQLRFVCTLHTEFAYVVARGVVLGRVFFKLTLADFAHIAKQMGAYVAGVLPGCAFLDAETLETEQLFAEERKFLGGNLGHEQLWGVARVARIFGRVFNVGHAFDVVLLGDAYCLAKVECVDAPLVVHHNHYVIRWFVVDEQPALAVEYQSARGVLYVLAEGVGVGILFVIVTPQL